MLLKISLKTLFLVIVLLQVLMANPIEEQEEQDEQEQLEQLPEVEDEDGFIPTTNQPLKYYPQPRIVGGRNANDGQFPHQVSLRSNGGHICGGSIISANYVVTAGHCVRGNVASRMSVRVGSRVRNAGGSVINVAEIKIHPQYRNFDNDIALLRLSNRLQFNNNVRTIALATQNPPSRASVVTSGWGRLGNNVGIPNILQYTTLSALTHAECSQRSGNVPVSVLCLGHNPGNGVCSGDSGGPAVYQNRLVGVTNYVVGGCASNYPDGYASVAYHNSWIRNNSDL